MTPEQAQAAQAQLTQVDTELAALDQTINDCIVQARDFNNKTRDARNKRTSLDAQAAPLRIAVAEYVRGVKQTQAAQAKAEADARSKAEAETKAKQASETDRLKAENEELKAKLAAKE